MFKYPKKSIYSIRKIKSITASVLIASSFLVTQSVFADETISSHSESLIDETSNSLTTNQIDNHTSESSPDINNPDSPTESDPILDLNLVSNSSFNSNDYVSSNPNTIRHRDKDKGNYFLDIEGDIVAKTKDSTTNDFLLFDINTEKGKSYTATADVYIAVPDGVVPSGAFFDIKSISQNGSQVTIPGGKSVEEMKDSIGKWSRQSISFVAVDNKTSLGLIKWDENPNSESTINTNVYLDNLKVTDNTKYSIVWQDNFSGKVLDQNVWGYELGNIRGNEQEHYSSSSDNISLKDGNLVLKVTDRPKEDQYRNTERLGNNARLVKYNSGSVRTHGKKEFLYGRIEAKAKLPKGKGVFPAFWTLGADFPIDGRIDGKQGYGWPSTGEIDIMELVGSPTNERTEMGEQGHYGNSNRISYGTPHFYYSKSKDGDKDGTYAPTRVGGNLTLSEDFYDKYHIFGINWTKDKLEWYVDDVVFRSIEFDKLDKGRREAIKLAFNRPHYIQFNLAAGGNWSGDAGDFLAKDGTEFKIDWVRWLQSDEQKTQMEDYYKQQPSIEGIKDVTFVEGTIPDLLDGVKTNSNEHHVEFSIDNEYMFINSGASDGRNEVKNIILNSSEKNKLSELKPGVYNLYYSAIPLGDKLSENLSPTQRVTRKSVLLTVLPNTLSAHIGDKLSQVNLPDGFFWENPEQIFTEDNTYKAIFINPNDNKTDFQKRRKVYINLPVIGLPVSQVTPTEGAKAVYVNKPELVLSRESIAYKTIEQVNPNLPKGERYVQVKGELGERLLLKEVVKVGDNVISSQDLPSLVTKEAVDEVVEVGSREVLAGTDGTISTNTHSYQSSFLPSQLSKEITSSKDSKESMRQDKEVSTEVEMPIYSRMERYHSSDSLPNTGEEGSSLFFVGMSLLGLGMVSKKRRRG